MELGFEFVVLYLREFHLPFLAISTGVENVASSVPKATLASGWYVCGAIPLFLTFACGVLHTEWVLES